MAIRSKGLIWALTVPLAMFAAFPVQPQIVDPVVASRGGVDILLSEVDAKVRMMPPDVQVGYTQDPDRIARLIDTLLLTKQVAVLAEQGDYAKSAEFKADLANARMDLLARYETDRQVALNTPPDLEPLARERYRANPDQWMTPPGVDVRHLLVSTDGRDEAAAKAKAEELLARVKGGEDFVDLIVKESDEKSRDTRKGFIPQVDPTRLDPDFVKALRKLKTVGEYSEVVRSAFGYHIIRLERADPPKLRPYDEVRPELMMAIREEFKQAKRNDFLRSLSNEQITFNGEVIKQLPTRYLPKPAQPAPAAE
jgi:peptidyl-prolyl cis-trans isomerase C